VKQIIFLVNIIFLPVLLFAQQSQSSLIGKDSIDHRSSKIVPINDSLSLSKSLPLLIDSSFVVENKSSELASSYNNTVNKILITNQFLNSTTQSVASVIQEKKRVSKDRLFYLVSIILLLLAFLRFVYTRYFNNLFSFFFNASLRQSQLIEQLLQSKLQSLLFNILFIFSGGLYIYLLLMYKHWVDYLDFWQILSYSSFGLGLLYLIKFFTIKFTGWITGFKEITNNYVFIVFLFNKIMGIFLLPFIVIIAFSIPVLVNSAVIISLLLIGILFLLRFLRSYALLPNKLKLSGFHFVMYIIGVEIIPVLIVYKGLVVLLSKNL
jgi:hypothetical protein